LVVVEIVKIIKIIIIKIVKIAGSWFCIDVDVRILLLSLSCCVVVTPRKDTCRYLETANVLFVLISNKRNPYRGSLVLLGEALRAQ
jgi:hypothetical protein